MNLKDDAANSPFVEACLIAIGALLWLAMSIILAVTFYRTSALNLPSGAVGNGSYDPASAVLATATLIAALATAVIASMQLYIMIVPPLVPLFMRIYKQKLVVPPLNKSEREVTATATKPKNACNKVVPIEQPLVQKPHFAQPEAESLTTTETKRPAEPE